MGNLLLLQKIYDTRVFAIDTDQDRDNNYLVLKLSEQVLHPAAGRTGTTLYLSLSQMGYT